MVTCLMRHEPGLKMLSKLTKYLLVGLDEELEIQQETSHPSSSATHFAASYLGALVCRQSCYFTADCTSV